MSDEQQYIYAIAHPHGYVKIGYSKNPQQRLSTHQTGSPYNLWILAQVPVNEPREVESELHDYFDDRVERGEWFEFGYADYDDLVDIVRMISSGHEFESVSDFRAWQRRKMEAML
jgi:hypothetical protein